MEMDVYFNSPIRYEILERDENLYVRYTKDGYKISFKGDDESFILSLIDEEISEGWYFGESEKLCEYMSDKYGLHAIRQDLTTNTVERFDTESEACLGISHSGPVYCSSTGSIELSDEEVSLLVALIKEKGTSDIKELELEETYPEIFEKLDDAYFRIAYEAEALHWLWYGYHEGVYEYDADELLSYCENECGFVFDGNEEDFVDEDGEFDEESYEEAKMEAFLDDWLLPYIESLDTSDQIGFFRDQMNASVEMDGNDVSYEVRIPEGIIELAKK